MEKKQKTEFWLPTRALAHGNETGGGAKAEIGKKKLRNLRTCFRDSLRG
jgi:hypothetical protein